MNTLRDASSDFDFNTGTVAPIVVLCAVVLLALRRILAFVARRRAVSAPSSPLLADKRDDDARSVAMQMPPSNDINNVASDCCTSPVDYRVVVVRLCITAAVFASVAFTSWLYYDAVGRHWDGWQWRGLDEYVVDPVTMKPVTAATAATKYVYHPAHGGLQSTKPIAFCYSLGTTVPVFFVAFAAWWRFGTKQQQHVDAAGVVVSPSSGLVTASCCWRLSLFTVGLLAALLLGALCTIASLSHYMLFCNYRAADFVRLCDFTHGFVQEIEAVAGNQTVWLHNGALLAAMRPFDRANNCFIPNDHDFDICVARDAFTKMLAYLRRSKVHYWNLEMNAPDAFHPRKVRVYPPWAKPYEGHAGMWCIDIDECTHRTEPLITLSGCNGHSWSATTLKDSVASFVVVWGNETPWNVPVSHNQESACKLLPGW